MPVLSPTSGLLDPEQFLLQRRARALGMLGDAPPAEPTEPKEAVGVVSGSAGPEQAAARRRRRASSVVLEAEAKQMWEDSQQLQAKHLAVLRKSGVTGKELEEQMEVRR